MTGVYVRPPDLRALVRRSSVDLRRAQIPRPPAYPVAEVTEMMRKFESDGHTRPATVEDMVPGAVIRLANHDGTISAYSDCTILRKTDIGWCVARPFVYAHGVSSTALTGVEEFEVSKSLFNPGREQQYLYVVMLSTEAPSSMLMDSD
jgi:hypothetical protein